MAWVHRQMESGTDPRDILQQMVPTGTDIPSDLSDFTLWRIIINLLSEPPKRKKLNTFNTLDDFLLLLKNAKKIMVLTGAGVSMINMSEFVIQKIAFSQEWAGNVNKI